MSRPIVATYRLQFRDGMTFDKAVGLVPYLHRLGISHLYASPLFTAVTGSTHGYDVTDHGEIDPALGGREGFERLHLALKAKGLGLILDIVPNHMAASLENPWWRDVVELGERSRYARHFDIDWSERLTLPILGKPFEEVLRDGDLSVTVDAKQGCLAFSYFETQLPLSPASYALVATRLADDGFTELSALAAGGSGPASMHDGVRSFLASEAAAHLDERLAGLSRDAGFLDELHEAQAWRLTFWKDARRHLSYRRFFEVTGLVGVRVEDDAVFDDVHALALALVRDGLVDGLRIDHVDGLALPGSYLARLRDAVGPDTPIFVEKILGAGEHLPQGWPDCGTTGYEFIPALADLLVAPEGLATLDRAYAAFAGAPLDLAAETRKAKELILRRNFAGELARLAELAARLPGIGGTPGDAIEDAIAEIIIGFDVYRTYGEGDRLSEADEARLDAAVARAQASGRASSEALRLIAEVVSGDAGGVSPQAQEFRARLQQLTGPVTAKAIEDTLFYRVNPLIAMNEVGASPGSGAGGVERFHAAMQARLADPPGLLATSTHDTKRGEDARARLYALSEAPDVWSDAVARWRDMNATFRRRHDGDPAPDAEVEWTIYQMLAGAWPDTSEQPSGGDSERLTGRLVAAVEKGLREAKRRTDWLDMDPAYEAPVLAFVKAILEPGNVAFLSDFHATLRPFVEAGAVNALSQTLAKLTVPGIPDIYQGSERIDLSLVDPDNRRAIDAAALAEGLAADGDIASTSLAGGALKQRIIAATLRYRSTHERLFRTGRYAPVALSGAASESAAAFLREAGEDAALVVLRRLSLQAPQADPQQFQLEIPERHRGRGFRDLFSAARITLQAATSGADLLGPLPVALWVAEPKITSAGSN